MAASLGHTVDQIRRAPRRRPGKLQLQLVEPLELLVEPVNDGHVGPPRPAAGR